MNDTFPDTRWSLIGRLGAGDDARLLVATYADAVARYLRTRLKGRDPAIIDDVVQEVLAGLLDAPEVLARAQPGPGSRFRHYLMHLAWNAARNALRRWQRGDNQPLIDTDAIAAHAADADADRAWAASVLAQAWDELRAQRDAGQVEAAVVAITEAHLIDGTSLRDLVSAEHGSLATCSRRLAQGRMLVQQAIVERLRVAGELAADETPAAASARLLAHFHQ